MSRYYTLPIRKNVPIEMFRGRAKYDDKIDHVFHAARRLCDNELSETGVIVASRNELCSTCADMQSLLDEHNRLIAVDREAVVNRMMAL